MTKLPEAVFILDTKKEHIGVTEANKLGIPIVAVVDTNCDPDLIQYVIPGNDDAIRAGTLMCRVIADAVEEGRLIASKRGGGAAAAQVAATRTAEDEARIAAQQADARRQGRVAAAGTRRPPRRSAGRGSARARRGAGCRTGTDAPTAEAPAETTEAEVSSAPDVATETTTEES